MQSRRSSDYKQLLTLQQRTLTQNSVGEKIESWADVTNGTRWCLLEHAYKGSEAFREGGDVRVAMTYFWVYTRYSSTMVALNPADYRWKYGSRYFDIIQVADPDGSKDEVHFLTEEIQA